MIHTFQQGIRINCKGKKLDIYSLNNDHILMIKIPSIKKTIYCGGFSLKAVKITKKKISQE